MTRILSTLQDTIQNRLPNPDDALGWLNLLYQYTTFYSRESNEAIKEVFKTKTLNAIRLNPTAELLPAIGYATSKNVLIDTCIEHGAFTRSALLQHLQVHHSIFAYHSRQSDAWKNMDQHELEHTLRMQWRRPMEEWVTSEHPMWSALGDVSHENRQALALNVLFPALQEYWPFQHESQRGSPKDFRKVLELWAAAWDIHPAQIVAASLLTQKSRLVDLRRNTQVYLTSYPAELREILDYHGHPRAREWLEYVPTGTGVCTISLPNILAIAAGEPFHPKTGFAKPIVEIDLPALS